MARHSFGGDISSWTLSRDVGDDKAVIEDGAVVTFWNQQSGGTRYTDLSTSQAAADGAGDITSVTSSDGGDGFPFGTIPAFYGPHDIYDMWAEADGGDRLKITANDVGSTLAATAVGTAAALAAHTAAVNPHNTAVGDLSDVLVATIASRSNGDVLQWDSAQQKWVNAASAGGVAAVLLDPPLSGATYVGNTAVEPPAAGGDTGAPWLTMIRSYSGSDSNPDTLQFKFAKNGAPATTFRGFWLNGNTEMRAAPSTVARIGFRAFESYINNGGPSTGIFAAFTTNPILSADREDLLGMYGTAHSTKPGWGEFTRVVSALLGVAAGGNYPTGAALSQGIWRGRKTTAGAPASGTYVAGDWLMDSAGAIWLCTAGGTPGTWVGTTAAPSAFVDVTPGTNVGHGTVHAGVRKESGNSVGRLQGSIVASGAVSGGATAFTIPATYRPATVQVCAVRRINTGANDAMTINTDGTCTFASALASGNEIVLGSITFPL